jgi:hypothetical protein
MLELAETVLSLTGSRSRMAFKPLPSDDPRQRKPDIAMARRLIEWEPTVALRDGLRETIAYFRRLMELPAGPSVHLPSIHLRSSLAPWTGEPQPAIEVPGA